MSDEHEAGEQKSRLAQLKQLQEQLQAKLYSQLSSCSYDEDDISEEMKQEILQTLGMTSSRQHNIQQHEHHSVSSLSGTNASPRLLTPPLDPYQSEALSQNPSSGLSANMVLPLDGTNTNVAANLGTLCAGTDSCNRIPLEAWYTSPSLRGSGDIVPCSPSVASTECLDLPDQSESQLTVREQEKDFEELARSLDGLDTGNVTSNQMGNSPPKDQSNINPSSSQSFSTEVPSQDLEELTNISNSPSKANQKDHHFSIHEYQTHASNSSPCRKTPSPQGSSPCRSSPHGSSPTVTSTCEQCPGLKTYLDQSLAEIAQWKLECSRLEKYVDDCLSINKNLAEKNSRLMRRMANFQQECESKEQLVSMLQSRITTLSEQLAGQDQTMVVMKEKTNELEEELGCVSREKKDLKELLRQTTTELDNKADEIAHLEMKLKALESQLRNAESKVSSLHTTLNVTKDRENQFQSTIYNMEEEIKSLRHINNKLNSQSTHFRLGNYSVQEDSSHLYNISDETKLVSPRGTGTADDAHLSLPPPRDASGISSSRRPLTRRKWLESSDGGFIFGSPSFTKEPETKEEKENTPSFSPRTPRNTRPSLRSSQQGETAFLSQLSPVEGVLQSIKDGKVSVSENSTGRLSGRVTKSPREKIEERVEARMKLVPVVEKKLAELQKEKEKLEYVLQRGPPAGKLTLQSKQMMMDAESRLDDVIKEIGTARLFLLESPSWKKN